MNLITLFGHLDTATILSIVTALVISPLSALCTSRPNALTGIITLGLSSASGFISEWAAAAGNHHAYNWQAGAGTALAAWLVAAGAHSKILSGTGVESFLHGIGSGGQSQVTEEADPDPDDVVAAPIEGPVTATQATAADPGQPQAGTPPVVPSADQGPAS